LTLSANPGRSEAEIEPRRIESNGKQTRAPAPVGISDKESRLYQ
jgi:hypothetical protein